MHSLEPLKLKALHTFDDNNNKQEGVSKNKQIEIHICIMHQQVVILALAVCPSVCCFFFYSFVLAGPLFLLQSQSINV